jgi:hypothetical protein
MSGCHLFLVPILSIHSGVRLGVVLRTVTSMKLTMVKCRSCSRAFPETRDDCPYCGALHYVETICPDCGFISIRRRYILCPRCRSILLSGRPIAQWLSIQIPITAMLAVAVYIQSEFNARAIAFIVMWLSMSGIAVWSTIWHARFTKRNRMVTDTLEGERLRRASRTESVGDEDDATS